MKNKLISIYSRSNIMGRVKENILHRINIKSSFRNLALLFAAAFFGTIVNSYFSEAQTYPASPANWLYPEGNSEGTRHTSIRSGSQEVDSFKVKWSTPTISGDIQPLIGNIINNDKIFSSYRWAPNEIAAVVGGKLVVVDSKGKTHKIAHPVPYVKGFSVLFDSTLARVSDSVTMPVVLGIETVEYENHVDSLAYAYLAGFDHNADTLAILQRLAINLRQYAPNIFASIRPVFGRRDGTGMNIYATMNMSKPTVTETDPINPPYLRGFTQFNTNIKTDNYPLPDVGDEYQGRMLVGPEVSFAQPSFSTKTSGESVVMLPFYQSPEYDVRIESDNIFNSPSYGDEVYMLGFNISTTFPDTEWGMQALNGSIISASAQRPQVRPYFVRLTDRRTGFEGVYILMAEEYRGIDGSTGRSKLHLFDELGGLLTEAGEEPPFYGANDHLWSVAVGNVDGRSANQWLPYYPNNTGNEIVVTQSSRDFAIASSKLCVLRYYSDYIEKPTPPNTFLNAFDTLVTQRINGWVAAVCDLDNGSDQKDEIILVDGSKLRILKMRDYASFEFRSGRPFDTLLTKEFDHQTITNVAVADLEGDGLTDIIITTNDSTYVLGSEILNIIDVTYPDVSIGTADYCPGDTILIQWRNILRGHKWVNIRYQKLNNNIPVGDPILVASEVNNWGDTLEYTLIADESFIGTEGYFIVESYGSPNRIFDRTTKMRFNYPLLNIDPLPDDAYQSGETVEFTGSVLCVDSLIVEYSYRYAPNNWMWLWSESVPTDGLYSIFVDMPCVEFFEPLLPDKDSIINIRMISYKSVYQDTTANIPVKIRPASFPFTFEPCTTACKSREFIWDVEDLNISCETVTIALDNESSTFSLIDQVPATDGRYVWHVPVNVPECVKVRLACENSCIRTDTIVAEFGEMRPKYIDIVAPNPFNPTMEQVEIIYQVPSTATVDVKVFDQNNRLVADLEKSVSRKPGIAYCARWDGRRWDGSFCDNGMYYVSIELSSGSKEVHPVFIKK